MAVAWDASGLRDPLIFFGPLEDHALAHLAEIVALDLLPWSLRSGILIAASGLQLVPTSLPFAFVHKRVGAAGIEVDAHAVAGPQQRQSAARRRFGRRIQDRRAPRCPGLAAVADAGKAVDAALDEI